jgi:hypothetical protein
MRLLVLRPTVLQAFTRAKQDGSAARAAALSELAANRAAPGAPSAYTR